MVRMGPDFIASEDRSADFLGHSGRAGGRKRPGHHPGRHPPDALARHAIHIKSGLPVPTQPYWDAVSTNNVSAQKPIQPPGNPTAAGTAGSRLPGALTDSAFLKMRASQQQHQVVRVAEKPRSRCPARIIAVPTFPLSNPIWASRWVPSPTLRPSHAQWKNAEPDGRSDHPGRLPTGADFYHRGSGQSPSSARQSSQNLVPFPSWMEITSEA